MSYEKREVGGDKGVVSRHSNKAANLGGLDSADLHRGQTFREHGSRCGEMRVHRRIQTSLSYTRKAKEARCFKSRQLAHSEKILSSGGSPGGPDSGSSIGKQHRVGCFR